MKNISLLAVVLMALSACSDRATSPPDEVARTDSGAATADASAEQVTPVECPKAFYSPLPDSAIHFDFPFQIARDRVYTSDAGAIRRGLELEYLDSDAARIWSRVGESMKNAGFVPKEGGTGEFQGNFSKQGVSTIFVSVKPEVIGEPANPDAKGSIWISWQLERSN